MAKSWITKLCLAAAIACTVLSCGFVMAAGMNEIEKETESSVSNDDALSLFKQEFPLINESKEYSLNFDRMSAYFTLDGHVPLISVSSFLSSLDGFFDTSSLETSVDAKNGRLKVAAPALNHRSASFYWNKDEISVYGTMGMPFLPTKEPSSGEMRQSYAKWVLGQDRGSFSKTFSLKYYGFDIFYFHGEVLVPLPILNTMFCSYAGANLLFNGQRFYFFSGTPSQEMLSLSKSSSLADPSCPQDVREASVNQLLFALNYFYGLKKNLGIEEFSGWFGNDLLGRMASQDPKEYTSAYIDALQKKLDQRQTKIIAPSFYLRQSEAPSFDDEANLGEKQIAFTQSLAQLGEARASSFQEEEAVRFSGDTAYIPIDDFRAASQEDVFESDGSVKEDAWQKDSFLYMEKAMGEISQHGEVKNVVLDLTENAGGNLLPMLEVAGFLTDERLLYTTYDVLGERSVRDYYRVDCDRDGNYDGDAYPQYNWGVLASSNTFGRANAFLSICKKMGIAKIFGEQSGGGMCLPTTHCLLDGTVFQMDGTLTERFPRFDNTWPKTYYDEIESGVIPDVEVSRADFFDLVTMTGIVDEAFSKTEPDTSEMGEAS